MSALDDDRRDAEAARQLLLRVYNRGNKGFNSLDRIIARLEAWQRAHTEGPK